MVAAIILDNRIIGVVIADADVDPVPPGWPPGSIFVNAPEKCDPAWIYDPIRGFTTPTPQRLLTLNKVEF